MVESRGRGIGCLLGQRPYHVLEGGGQRLILVDGSIEQKLARSFEIMFFLQGLEETIGGAEIGNYDGLE